MPDQARHSIRAQLMRLSLVIVVVSTALSMAGALLLTLRSERAGLDRNLLNSASMLSRVPMVADALRGAAAPEDLAWFLDDVTAHVSDIDLILVGDAEGILLYAPDHGDIGTLYQGTIQERILAGEEAFTSNITGPMGSDHSACAPVRGADGELLGFVIVGVYLRSMTHVTVSTVLHDLGIGILAAGLGVLLALRLSRRIKDSLMGYEPDALARRFHQREDILDALEEGVLALNLSEQYGGLTDISLTVADYCIVLTMSQLDGVEAVEINVAGQPVSYRNHQILTREEAVLSQPGQGQEARNEGA